jgi:hypothetical protein
MRYLTVCVTRRVIDHVKAAGQSGQSRQQLAIGDSFPQEFAGQSQQQLAIRDSFPQEFSDLIRRCTSCNRIIVETGDATSLIIGDSGAIWRSHQGERQISYFTDLYKQLSAKPDIHVRIDVVEIIKWTNPSSLFM